MQHWSGIGGCLSLANFPSLQLHFTSLERLCIHHTSDCSCAGSTAAGRLHNTIHLGMGGSNLRIAADRWSVCPPTHPPPRPLYVFFNNEVVPVAECRARTCSGGGAGGRVPTSNIHTHALIQSLLFFMHGSLLGVWVRCRCEEVTTTGLEWDVTKARWVANVCC